jgi:omega-amidase
MAASGEEPPTKKSKCDFDKLKIALCQLEVGPDKDENISRARKAIEDAADAGAQFVVLPECWNCPYGTKYFDKYAEKLPAAQEKELICGPSVAMLCEVAEQKKIFICGGSNPEREDGKLFNAGVVVDQKGSIVCKYRKVHLFDIDIPGKMTFKESDVLTAGSEPTVFQTPWGTMGVAICYDMRFPELAMLMRSQGAKVILYPGAFNTTTGPKHYELLARARAVDNQCFVIQCSPARLPDFEYQAWGHSAVVDPWGKVMETSDEKPCTVHAELDLNEVDTFRTNVPISKQVRTDIYKLEAVKPLRSWASST